MCELRVKATFTNKRILRSIHNSIVVVVIFVLLQGRQEVSVYRRYKA